MIDALDRLVRGLLVVLKWLALPVALLLFLQWPLREGLKAYSREVNDIGQYLFALFVAASITAATRTKHHLASDVIAAGYTERARRRLALAGMLLGLLPWAGLVAWAAWPAVAQSVAQAERFPDTGNPGYFVIKIALLLCLVLIIAQSAIDIFKAPPPPPATDRDR